MSTQLCAQVRNGVVLNIFTIDPLTPLTDGSALVPCATTVQVGWLYANGVFSAPPVVNQTTNLSFLQFVALFTETEQAAVVASSDAQVKLFLLMAAGASWIDLINPEVVNGVNYLASLGLITSARAAVILSGAAPS